LWLLYTQSYHTIDTASTLARTMLRNFVTLSYTIIELSTSGCTVRVLDTVSQLTCLSSSAVLARSTIAALRPLVGLPNFFRIACLMPNVKFVNDQSCQCCRLVARLIVLIADVRFAHCSGMQADYFDVV
jgi:hypothetical protein